jgi:hypothetical protein
MHIGDHTINHYHNTGSYLLSEELYRRKEDAILKSLRYPENDWSFNSVDENCSGTFQWIFERNVPVPYRDFNSGTRVLGNALPGWLFEHNRGFLITGKGGSGKSTLMMFFIEEPRNIALLERWASHCERRLIRASFFFWSSGNNLQGSQILFQLLQQHRALKYETFKSRLNENSARLDDLEKQPWTRIMHRFVGDPVVTMDPYFA